MPSGEWLVFPTPDAASDLWILSAYAYVTVCLYLYRYCQCMFCSNSPWMLLLSPAVNFFEWHGTDNECGFSTEWSGWLVSFHLSWFWARMWGLAVSILDSIMKGIIEIEILSHSMQKVRELMLCYIQTIHLLRLLFFPPLTVCRGKQMCHREGNASSVLRTFPASDNTHCLSLFWGCSRVVLSS